MEVWIGRDGERHGPYQESDVREWLRSGKVSRQDLGWYEGLADWQPLSVLFPDDLTIASAYAAPSSTGDLPRTTTASLEDYAGFWKRVAAYILDAIVLFIPNKIIMAVLGGSAAEETMKQAIMASPGDPHAVMSAYGAYYSAMGPAMLLITAVGWLYFAVCESSAWQGTVGKLALGIRVTDLEGRRISFLRALGRYPAKWLSSIILCIGFLMVAFTQRKQGLHDFIAGTLVLNGRASEFKDRSRPSGGSNGSLNA